jgi:glutamate-ammonia-ligase adenylyltransferase
MHIEQLRACLESVEACRALLRPWGLRDSERGWRNLRHLADAISPEGVRDLSPALTRILPRCPDPDMALNNLERFFATPAGPGKLPVLLEGRARTLEMLLQLVSTSQLFSDLLGSDPDSLELLRAPPRRSLSRDELREQLRAEVDASYEDSAVLRAFRRFRQRQVLRIGTNDVIRDRPLEEITRDLSRVADAAIDVALATALRHLGRRFGDPYTAAGQPARCAVLAFGKLGGEELNYSSDIDLTFVYDEDGQTRPSRGTGIGNDEFFGRVVGEVVRLLSAHTDRGLAFRVDLRLRPEGHRGPLARSLASALSYYDTLGRTWERQALIKLRPVAGDVELGTRFLKEIESFVYRKYLTFGEINEIKATKRRIEHRAGRNGVQITDVKTGRGGIRDIEFAIQFLQLLNGGDIPPVRGRNTLQAMQALESAGCLTDQEYRVLEDAYRFLRKTEHRLQLLFDLQTHRLPDRPDELRTLALRMGYRKRSTTGAGRVRGRERPRSPLDDAPPEPAHDLDALLVEPLDAFLHDYQEKTEPTRRILDHLLHATFPGEGGSSEPESDLLLDPNPDPDTIRAVLGRFPFKDIPGAYHNLNLLARESVPFLSTPRCRHFLASIAPGLLRAVAETPDPDMAMINLEKVTDSLGAKTVLWELFSFNPPMLKLYVDLCAWSQFLSEILINNPGMIDELLDSLVLNQPRAADELRCELADLCRGADDTEPILHSFRDKELLRIGVRDILGKESMTATTAALSDLAETILVQVTQPLSAPLEKRYGVPTLADGPRAGEHARFALLALGKLGGRELSYHSDLDLLLVYEGDGRTEATSGPTRPARLEQTDNFHFFTELAQRIIKAMSFPGPMGRLYQIDMRLRPTGRSGSLVVTLDEFARYYTSNRESAAHPEGGAHLWERQALTRARFLTGDAEFGRQVMESAEQAAYNLPWLTGYADEVLAMRQRLEASRSIRDLKRGPGGIMDVEFLIQLLKIKYGRLQPELRQTNTRDSLARLTDAGLLRADEADQLREAYDFLARVQGRLRIVHNRSIDEVPEVSQEVEKLARRLGFESGPFGSAGACFLAELREHTGRTRALFLRVIEREGSAMLG